MKKNTNQSLIINMKTLQQFITEKILINKNSKIVYNYHPKTKDELKDIINQKIESRGNECDLNDIDTSNITDMSNLFAYSHFNGDISRWNVSKVTNMSGIFYSSRFNGNISNWDVSNVECMAGMFRVSTFDTSQVEISPLNFEYLNILFILVTLDTSQFDISPVNTDS